MKIMTIKRFLAIVILNLYEIVCLAAEQHGVEHIQEGWKYNYWIRTGGSTLSGFGYELQPGRHKYGYSSFTIDSWETANERTPVESWKDNPIVTRHSFSDDIRAAILDRDRFDVALLQNRFADAWRMGNNTEQGLLWREIALGQTKKYLKQLVRESVFENNSDKMAQARAVSGSFPETLTNELVAYIEEENTSAQKILRNLVPDAAARLTALRMITDKLFE